LTEKRQCQRLVLPDHKWQVRNGLIQDMGQGRAQLQTVEEWFRNARWQINTDVFQKYPLAICLGSF
jgi:hypothetical protein